MKDLLGRDIHYLRISVTDRCNLRCSYCMPDQGFVPTPHEEILRYHEIERIVRVMTHLGICRVRLTGGEPLVRKNLDELITHLKAMEGIDYIGMTTNGTLLHEETTKNLWKAGINGLNISMDTMNPQKYKSITKRSMWDKAWEGLQNALIHPFESIKVNCVLSPESLEEDWLGVIALAKDLPIEVRLIEWMPLTNQPEDSTISIEQAKKRIEESFGTLHPIPKKDGGPAVLYQLSNFKGRIGLIGAMSNCFCEDCNRVRLTSDGDLKLCLFYDQGISLKPLIRNGISDEALQEVIRNAILHKPKQHQGIKKVTEDFNNTDNLLERKRSMFQIGG